MVNKWRLLLDQPLPGAVNMQRDLEIVEEVAAGKAPPTLRLYRWAPPALSTGRFQDPGRVADPEACRRLGIDLLRRPTGGRALLHHRELTYSIVLPDRREIIPAGVLPSYRFISRALLLAFETLQIKAELSPESAGGTDLLPGSCFDTPSAYELRVQGKKVVGSAQLRRKGVLLQHGSILLSRPLEIYRRILRFPEGSNGDAYLASLRQRSAGLLDLGCKISTDELSGALAAGFADLFNIAWI
ncbi:MAG: lipoate--protein ligase family protein [Firmicutes bacterium]|nr:lipoate--protein ligase family protein [Bacillota bacterium]